MSEPSTINNPDQPTTTNPPKELFDKAELKKYVTPEEMAELEANH